MCLECHVVLVKGQFTRLDILKKACERLGFVFKENQKSYQWYNRWMNDYGKQEGQEDAAYLQGVSTEDYGKCDHAIQVPGCKYEVGVLEKEGELQLIWDFYDKGLEKAMGGKESGKLLQGYQVEVAIEKAEQLGYPWEIVEMEDGSVNVEVELLGG